MIMAKRVAYLGPAGTFTEDACLRYDPQAARIPFPSIAMVAEAVITGKADEGITPIENSLEGSVTATLDLLIHGSSLMIQNELVLPIHLYLLGGPNVQKESIDAIYSHTQPLGQCREFLSEKYPAVELIASLSTASAVKDMMKAEGNAAAIGNKHAAKIYGAQVLSERIEDNPNNSTRFVTLAKSDHERTGDDKTSVAFWFADDAPGILYQTLGELSTRGINLAKVESRPTKESLGRYIFLIDLEGHRDDDMVRVALEAVESQVTMLKILGSYPRYAGNTR